MSGGVQVNDVAVVNDQPTLNTAVDALVMKKEFSKPEDAFRLEEICTLYTLYFVHTPPCSQALFYSI